MILPSEKTEEKLTPLRKYLDTLDIMRDLIKIEMQGKLFRAFRLFAPALATLFMRELRLQKTVVEKKVLNLISPVVRLIVKKYTHSAFLAGREMGEVVLSQRIQKGLFGWKMFETKEEKIEAQKAEKRAKFEAESNLTLRLNAATQQYSVSVKQLVSEMLLHKMSRSQTQKKIGEEIRGGKRETGTYFNAVVAAEQSYLFDVADAAAQEVFACQNLQELEKWKWVAFFTRTCPDCIERHGQVKTYKQWQNVGVPRAGQTVCRSHCHCVLLPDFYAVDIAAPVKRERAKLGTNIVKITDSPKKVLKPKPLLEPKLDAIYTNSEKDNTPFKRKESRENFEVDFDGKDFKIKIEDKEFILSSLTEEGQKPEKVSKDKVFQLDQIARGRCKINITQAKDFSKRSREHAKKEIEIGDTFEFDTKKARASKFTSPINFAVQGKVIGTENRIRIPRTENTIATLHTHPGDSTFSTQDVYIFHRNTIPLKLVYNDDRQSYYLLIKPKNRTVGNPGSFTSHKFMNAVFGGFSSSEKEYDHHFNITLPKLYKTLGYTYKEARNVKDLQRVIRKGLKEAGYGKKAAKPKPEPKPVPKPKPGGKNE